MTLAQRIEPVNAKLERIAQQYLKYETVLNAFFEEMEYYKKCTNQEEDTYSWCNSGCHEFPQNLFDYYKDAQKVLAFLKQKRIETYGLPKQNGSRCAYLTGSGCLVKQYKSPFCYLELGYSNLYFLKEDLQINFPDESIFNNLIHILSGGLEREYSLRDDIKTYTYILLSKNPDKSVSQMEKQNRIIEPAELQKRMQEYLEAESLLTKFFSELDFCVPNCIKKDKKEGCCVRNYFEEGGPISARSNLVLYALGQERNKIYGLPAKEEEGRCGYLTKAGCSLKSHKAFLCLSYVCPDMESHLHRNYNIVLNRKIVDNHLRAIVNGKSTPKMNSDFNDKIEHYTRIVGNKK